MLDPVCKMQVDEKRAEVANVYEGKTYYFCCETCKKTFEKSPRKYVEKKK